MATDEELMQAIAVHDAAAFNEFVSRHLNSLYAYALRLGSAPSAAEDLVQEVWIAVWQKAHTYKPRKVKVTTWLFRILHNKYIDGQRKQQPVYDSETIEQAFGVESAESGAIEKEFYQGYTLALIELPEQQRAALLLAYVQGFTNPEVAQILGISVRAVESLLARARRKLKQNPLMRNVDE